jgi:hypothetical protein
MSLSIYHQCERCDFNFLGGYGVWSYFNGLCYQFRAICKNCLTNFSIYSEDLRYLDPLQQCFLLTESFDPNKYYQQLKKIELRYWNRRIKRAKKDDLKELELEVQNLKQSKKTQALNLINNELKSGITLQVTKSKNEIRIELDNMYLNRIICIFCS